jgi:hypothetical protein
MSCEERNKLLDLVLSAVRAHTEAINALSRAHRRATEAEAAYQDSFEALEAHERSHECGGKAIGKAAEKN